jgi:hypothetical protein
LQDEAAETRRKLRNLETVSKAAAPPPEGGPSKLRETEWANKRLAELEQQTTSGRMLNIPATGGSGSGTFTQAQVADRAFWTANKDAILQAMCEGRIMMD